MRLGGASSPHAPLCVARTRRLSGTAETNDERNLRLRRPWGRALAVSAERALPRPDPLSRAHCGASSSTDRSTNLQSGRWQSRRWHSGRRLRALAAPPRHAPRAWGTTPRPVTATPPPSAGSACARGSRTARSRRPAPARAPSTSAAWRAGSCSRRAARRRRPAGPGAGRRLLVDPRPKAPRPGTAARPVLPAAAGGPAGAGRSALPRPSRPPRQHPCPDTPPPDSATAAMGTGAQCSARPSPGWCRRLQSWR